MSELHAFTTAAKTGSFTRAADHLCVTQGAISRAIARLESHFGQPLLTRGPGGLVLTPAGRKLLEGTAQPLEAIERVSRELRAPVANDALCVSVVPTLASVWLMPRLPDFHQRHPGIRLEFAPYRRDEDFSGEQPHAAILSGVPGERPGWGCDYVIGREVIVICHPDRLRARRAARRWRTPAELLDEPLISHANAPENWLHWFRSVGVEPTGVSGPRMDQVSIIVRAVMADIGIAVLQRCLVEEELANGRVAVPFNLPVSLRHGYILCSPERYAGHVPLNHFRKWLLKSAGGDTANQRPASADQARAVPGVFEPSTGLSST